MKKKKDTDRKESFDESKGKQFFDDYYMSKKLAARYTGLSTDTLDHHSIVIGDLPRFKPAGKVLYRKSDLDKWLQSYLDVKRDRFDPVRLAEEMLSKLEEKIERSRTDPSRTKRKRKPSIEQAS